MLLHYRQCFRLLILALLLSLAMGFCYVKVQPVDARWHNQVLDWLRELRRMEAILDQEILLAYRHHRPNYDPLVASMKHIEGVYQHLLDAVALLSTENDVEQALRAYRKALQVKEPLLEQFKSHNAVLLNSLYYLPQAITELRTVLPQGSGAVGSIPEEMLQNILLSDFKPELAPLATSQKDHLAALEARSSPMVANALFYITLHAEVLLRERAKVETLVALLFVKPEKDPADLIFKAYTKHFQAMEANSKLYLNFLFIFSGLLVFNIIYLIMRYVNLANTLRLSNESLEDKVTQRTQALSDLNQSLQRELTERARIEAEAQANETRYHSLTQMAMDAIITANGQGVILSWNRGATEMFGLSEEAALGQPLTCLMPVRFHEAHRQGLAHYFELGESKIKGKPTESVGLYVDGSEFPVELAITSWVSGGQRYFGGILRDITEHKEAEHALRAAKEEAESANRLKSTFLANMSHEIRTPMNAVLGYAQVLLASADLTAQHREAVQAIDTAGEHLLVLINEILDISKIESGKMTLNFSDFDVMELVEGLSDLFRSRCTPSGIIFQLSNTLGVHKMVHGDLGKLRQVLINLIGNAVKFSGPGDIVSFSLSSEKGQYAFSVKDNGPGISPLEQAALFQPFHQGEEGANKGGTGLGLAIAKRQVEIMGGELTLQSEPGQGCHFFFTLSLPEASGPVKERGQRLKNASLQRLAPDCNVLALVVDDIKDNRMVLSAILTQVGVEVILATNGQEALEKLHERRADIVFMDIRMPVMGGMEAFRLMQAQFSPPIPCVVVSASSLIHERTYYMQEGFSDFIAKPFRVETVLESMHQLLDIEFNSAEQEALPDSTSAAMPLQVDLPSALVVQLQEMAEMGAVTGISELLETIVKMGAAQKSLADALTQYMTSYDMDGFLQLIETVVRKIEAS